MVIILPPAFRLRVPLIVVPVPGFNVADVLILLKLVVPVMVAFVRKTTVPVPALNVPLLVKFPDMLNVDEPLIVNDAPELIVTLAAEDDVLITGKLGLPAEITTAVLDVGTPPHQLDAVFQLVLVVPNQMPSLLN